MCEIARTTFFFFVFFSRLAESGAWWESVDFKKVEMRCQDVRTAEIPPFPNPISDGSSGLGEMRQIISGAAILLLAVEPCRSLATRRS